MTNRILAGLLVTLSVALAGCSTPGYKCPLSDTGDDCASMSSAYSAAIQSQRGEFAGSGFAGKEPVSVFSRQVSQKPIAASGSAGFTGFPADAPHGGPVYAQAQVHRVWSAPWTDASGVLHGGEYMYFTTPGYWRYGETMAAGKVAGIFTPVKPNAFGIAEFNQSDKHVDLARDKISPQSTSNLKSATPAAHALNSAGTN